MKVAALIVGILGAVAAFLMALFAGSVGTVSAALHQPQGGEVTGLALSAWGASILGLVGAILALSKPVGAWICLLIAAAWVVISISAFGVPGGVLLFVAALLSFLEARSQKKRRLTVSA